MRVPEAAYEASVEQVCEAGGETVEMVVNQHVHISECKDSDTIYIGVPIYGTTGRAA
jgi:hypothetical protein